MLDSLLNEISEVNFFVHDSLHTYDYMMRSMK